MKNKNLTYVLVLAVAVIWGLIIYRIIQSLNADDDTPIIVAQQKKENFNDYELKPDTSKLLLNYRDPFGLTTRKDTVAVKKTTSTATIVPATKPAVDWSFISYTGYISDPDSHKLIAILSVNNTKAMLAEGESFGGVKVLKNMREFVKLSFNGEVKTITLHSATP